MSRFRIAHLATVLVSTALVALSSAALATDIYWKNTSGGAWSVAANWNPAQVPGPNDNAYITGQDNYYVVSLDADVTVNHLYLAGGASYEGGEHRLLTNLHNLTLTTGGTVGALDVVGSTVNFGGPLSGYLELRGATLNGNLTDVGIRATGGNSTLSGVLNTTSTTLIQVAAEEENALLSLSSGFTNLGTLYLTANSALQATLEVPGSGTLINAAGGIIDAVGTGTRVLAAQLDNRGAVQPNASLLIDKSGAQHVNSGIIWTPGGFRVRGSTSFTNTGYIDIWAGTFTMESGAFTNQPGGILCGSGTLDVTNASFTNSGTIEPGDVYTASTLTIAGNYRQSPTGTLHVQVGRKAGVPSDLLQVSGVATLDGDLDVGIVASAIPIQAGDRFTIMTFNGRQGTFASLNGLDIGGGLALLPEYTNSSLTLVAGPVGDTRGPAVIASSLGVSPNPIMRPNPASLSARVSDANSGGGTVAAAEWSIGSYPAPAGYGAPMAGSFGATSVDVDGALDTGPFATGLQKLWVRGRDAAGNWGPASALEVQVNEASVAVGDGRPAVAFLAQNAPNPFGRATLISFGLSQGGHVELAIFDAQGRQISRLVSGSLEAGVHSVSWDRRGDRGDRVGPGVYYYRLLTAGKSLVRRLAVLD